MRVILLLVCGIAVLFGAAYASVSQSAVHEGVAAVLFLIAAVLFSGFAIVNAIQWQGEKICKALAEPRKDTPGTVPPAAHELGKRIRKSLVGPPSEEISSTRKGSIYRVHGISEEGKAVKADLRAADEADAYRQARAVMQQVTKLERI